MTWTAFKQTLLYRRSTEHFTLPATFAPHTRKVNNVQPHVALNTFAVSPLHYGLCGVLRNVFLGTHKV